MDNNNKYISSINVNNTKYPISSSKMNNIDTGMINNNPQWYITNYSNSVVSETNKNSVVSSPFSSTYCTITTYIPSNGNGYPKQVLFDTDTNNMAIRNGISNTEWSKWTNYYTKEEINNGLFEEVPVTVSGTTVSTDMVSPVEHEVKCRVNRINLLPFPYDGEIEPINTELKINVNKDGSIVVNGTPSKKTRFELISGLYHLETGKKYFISGGRSKSDYFIEVNYGGKYYHIDSSGLELIGDSSKYFLMRYYFKENHTFDNVVLNPMINIGSTPLQYVPYVSNLESVVVNRYGKNLVSLGKTHTVAAGVKFTPNDNDTLTISGAKDGNGYMDIVKPDSTGSNMIKVLLPGTYTLITEILSGDFTINNGTHFSININDTGIYPPIANISYKNGERGKKYITFTINSIKNIYSLQMTCFSSSIFKDVVMKIALVVGNNTEFSPFIFGQHFTPSSDGTVSNMTSISPSMTILTDNPNVTIEATYNADVSKYTVNQPLTQEQMLDADNLKFDRKTYDKETLGELYNEVPVTVSSEVISTNMVSEIEHNVKCNIESRNLLSIENKSGEIGTEVKYDITKGIINITATNNQENKYFWPIDKETPYIIQESGNYVFSGVPVTNNPDPIFMGLWVNGIQKGGSAPISNLNIYLNKGDKISISIAVYKGSGTFIIKPQLEKGNIATPFVKGIPDLSKVKISRYGKNLLDIERWIEYANTVNTGGEAILDTVYIGKKCSKFGLWNQGRNKDYFYFLPFKKNTRYVISAYVTSEDLRIHPFIGIKYSDGTYSYGEYQPESKKFQLVQCITDSSKTVSSIYIPNYSFGSYDYIYNFQLYEGSQFTEFEPCNSENITPSLDGTVSNMTSISPYMTILSDTPGVNITATYNANTSKYIESNQPLTQEQLKLAHDLEIDRQQEYVDESLVRMIPITESGTSISTDMVSNIEHSVDCKVESKNLITGLINTSFNGVTVKVLPDGKLHIYGTATSNIRDPISNRNTFTLQKGTVVCFSSSDLIQGDPYVSFFIDCYSVHDGHYVQVVPPIGGNAVKTTTIKEDVNCTVYFAVNKSDIPIDFTTGLMLEKGTVATPYTPYFTDLSSVKISQYNHLLDGDAAVKLSNSKGVFIFSKTRLLYNTGSIPIKIPVPISIKSDLTFILGLVPGGKAKNRVSFRCVYTDGTEEVFNSYVNLTGYEEEITYLKLHSNPNKSVSYIYSLYTNAINVIIRLDHSAILVGNYEGESIDTELCKIINFTPSLDGTVSNMTSISPYMNIFTDNPNVLITATYGSDASKYKQVYGNITKELAKESVDFVNSHVVTESTKKYAMPRTKGTRGQFALSDGNGGIMFETFINRADIGL